MNEALSKAIKALKPFADAYKAWNGGDSIGHFGMGCIPQDFRRAAEALSALNASNMEKEPERLTQHQALVLTGFTGIMCVNSFSDFHGDVEKRLGRPVWTHQFPSLNDEIKKAYEADFMAMLPDAAVAQKGGGNV